MPSIEVDSETHDRLSLVARVNGEPIGAVVRRLLDRLAEVAVAAPAVESPLPTGTSVAAVAEPGRQMDHGGDMDGWVPVHKIYKGHRIEGYFHPSSHEIRLRSEPWANQYFASPTAAAIKVVDHYAGDVRQTPNTNGRKFWKITATGKDLRSIIGER